MEKTSRHIDQNKKVIAIRDVAKSFGSNHVLKGINLDLHQGENVVILGRSGTGKSVLIKMIVGLLKPNRGSIDVLDKDIARLNNKQMDELRVRIGFSFQSAALYDSMTVRENIAFPLLRNYRNLSAGEVEKAVRKALEAVELAKTINQMPVELSGGQRKRVGIARALIMQPQIMLYDEPTAGLDPVTSFEINKLINQVQDSYHTSSIIITHDLTCAKATGDRIAVLMDGQFVAMGSFAEVFKEPDEGIQSFYDYNFIL